MGGIGFSELLLIFIVVMILFGSKKLPEFAKSLGQALKEFRRAARDIETTTSYTVSQEEAEEKPKELKAITTEEKSDTEKEEAIKQTA